MKERGMSPLRTESIFYSLLEGFSTVNVTGSITKTLKTFTYLVFAASMSFLFFMLINNVKENLFLFFDLLLAVLFLCASQLLRPTKKYLLKHINRSFEFFGRPERMSKMFDGFHCVPTH